MAQLKAKESELMEQNAALRQELNDGKKKMVGLLFKAVDTNNLLSEVYKAASSTPVTEADRGLRHNLDHNGIRFEFQKSTRFYLWAIKTGSAVSLVLCSMYGKKLCKKRISVDLMNPLTGDFEPVFETHWPSTCTVDTVANNLLEGASARSWINIAVCQYNWMPLREFDAKYVKAGAIIAGIRR